MICHGDCTHSLNLIKDSSVDVVFTSPPYKTKEGYSDFLIQKVALEAERILKPGGIYFLNFGQLSEDPTRFLRVAMITAEHLDLGPVINWVKAEPELGGQFRPLPGSSWLNRKWEPIYVFSKDKRVLDRLSIGIEYKYKSNIDRFNHQSPLQCRGDVWFHPYSTIKSGSDRAHIYQMPFDLVMNCLKLAGVGPGSLVLDPFAGSGTTIECAKQLGAKGMGFNI